MATTTATTTTTTTEDATEPSLNYLQHGNLTIAVEGCGHGALNDIYSSIARTSAIHNLTVSLLIICGDFQAIRNHHDLPCMSVPPKYRELGDFASYYSGERTAPITTIYIGGNHEASNHHFELFHGGWVCPNIYYLGAAGVVNFGGLRIGGISGIYKSGDYIKGCYERVPYVGGMLKSAYHIREYDVFRLFQVREPLDIGLSHDWPVGIAHFGDTEGLLRTKPYFRADHETGELGSKPAWGLLRKWRPRFWFSGHMHVKFSALVDHELLDRQEGLDGQGKPEIRNEEEIDLDMDDSPNEEEKTNEEEIDLDALGEDAMPESKPPPKAELVKDMEVNMKDSSPAPPSKPTDPHPTGPLPTVNNTTRFLALDKIGPPRSFLQILNIPLRADSTTSNAPSSSSSSFPQSTPKLCYDPEWLSIVKTFSQLIPSRQRPIQRNLEEALQKLEENRAWVEENIVSKNKLTIPENFEITAPTQLEIGPVHLYNEVQSEEYRNPQTAAFCNLLGIENRIWSTDVEKERRKKDWEIAMERERMADGGNGGFRNNRGRNNGRGRGGRRGRR